MGIFFKNIRTGKYLLLLHSATSVANIIINFLLCDLRSELCWHYNDERDQKYPKTYNSFI